MRNYKEYPLKNRELIPEEDLYELFIIQNLSAKEIANLLDINKSRVNNCIRKYGFHKTKEQKEAVKIRLNMKKYGTSHYFKTEEFKQKKEKACLEKYGTLNFSNNLKIKEKRKDTCLKRYGVENPNQYEKFKKKREQTCLKKYGIKNHNNLKSVKNKCKQTCLEKYNVENISQLNEVKQKKLNTFKNNYNSIEKRIELKNRKQLTNIEKFGAKTFAESQYCNHKELQEKRDKTLAKNKTYNTSKSEEKIYNLLLEKFKDIKRNYKTSLYPFKCDFYIPSLDLYIEYNEHVSHGKHPFDINNEKDIEQMNLWKKRLEEINYKGKQKKAYKIFIETWTKRDPLKRLVAKENNLNWLEFFTLKEFLNWYEKL